jgi:hypothetical protein
MGGQAILYPDGSRKSIQGTFINTGTTPPGSMWARIPIPSAGLGPRCLPGPNDTNSTPFGCQPWEGRNDGHNGHVPGPCVRCPETPGSDCSRCGNNGTAAFPPPFSGVQGAPQQGILDIIKISADLTPGDYVLGWRCEIPRRLVASADTLTLESTVSANQCRAVTVYSSHHCR